MNRSSDADWKLKFEQIKRDVVSWFDDDDDSPYRTAPELSRGKRGKGPDGYERPDERIYEEVCDELCDHDALDATTIKVEVHHGIVTLIGEVDSRWEKKAAELVADRARGVFDVQNHLTVRRAEPDSTKN